MSGLIAYRWDRHKGALNIENLLDESYALRASGARFVQMGDRLGFPATYSITF